MKDAANLSGLVVVVYYWSPRCPALTREYTATGETTSFLLHNHPIELI
jgi:hypothetical protein